MMKSYKSPYEESELGENSWFARKPEKQFLKPKPAPRCKTGKKRHVSASFAPNGAALVTSISANDNIQCHMHQQENTLYWFEQLQPRKPANLIDMSMEQIYEQVR